MFTSDQVKDMTHTDRMLALGDTVRQRVRANDEATAPGVSFKRKAAALESHRVAARNADVLRYR